MAKTSYDTTDIVYKGIIAQILPAVLTGGHWRFYSVHTVEYAQMLETISNYNKNVSDNTKAIQYKQLDGGLLVYTTVDEMLQLLPEIQTENKMPVSDTNVLLQQYLTLLESEQMLFEQALLAGLQKTDNCSVDFSFGMYLDGFAGQTTTIDGVVYALYKLDANAVFKALYKYWWKHKKPVMYVCARGNVKELTPMFRKYGELLAARKNGTLNTQALQQLQTMGIRILTPMLTPLFTGEALMCTIMVK